MSGQPQQPIDSEKPLHPDRAAEAIAADAPKGDEGGEEPDVLVRSQAGWKAKLLLVAGSFAFMFFLLLMGELYCRWFLNINALGNSRNLFVANAMGDSRGNRKNAVGVSFGTKVHIDSNGFRIDPDFADPTQTRTALLILGDSVAFGPGVPEKRTFAGKLRRANADMRIFNSSVIGYAAKDYANVAKHFVPKHPEIRRAYLMFCLNDISVASARKIDATFKPDARRKDSVEKMKGGWLGSVNRFLRNKSKLYLWLKTKLTDPRKRHFEADRANYLSDDGVFALGMKPMLTVRDVLAQHSVSLTVVILPYAAQLRDSPPSKLEPQIKITEFLKNHKIRYIDATEHLAQRGGDLFLFGDPMHFNAAGHTAVFDLLTADLNAPMAAPSP